MRTLERIILRPNTSADATCDELVCENHSSYEKSNVIERCCSGRGPDAGFVLEHDTGDYHNDNASDHSPNGSPANGSRFTDDDNDAYGRRLLILPKPSAVASGCRHGPVASFAFQKAALNSTGHKAGGYSRE